ncbi:MAG TPA: L-glutamate gamma-semialdehyde dehydrogenase [Vicinamibacteria bacterium]|nr:L-glutamate gamma-semialdehyde dehydrogenase [Vicinamibacteria bacterium]
MTNAVFNVPEPRNEPVLSYAPGSTERESLRAVLDDMLGKEVEIPIIVGGKQIRTGDMGECRCPHDHRHVLGRYHKATPQIVSEAERAAAEAWREWSVMDWRARASVFLKLAELLAGKYRAILNASTMLGQSKTPHQAEIDAACELIDFYRFNTYYMQQIYEGQPASAPGMWNYVEYRALEGFIFAVTPFNFTSIGGNLPTSPALMGNTVLWKPASSAIYSAYYLTELFREAGLPDGVINFIPGSGGKVGGPVMELDTMAGIHFTGSTEVFQNMWATVGNNIKKYKVYPRIVGETGGKNYIFVHPSANLDAVVANAIRGAYEYQGQKCSAASRVYIPKSLWPGFKERFVAEVETIKMGDVTDFTNFMGAVIDEEAFKSITAYIDYAKDSSEAEIVTGGEYDDSKGYFIEPTAVLTDNPKFKLMEEEIFGPVLTLYVYPDGEYEETLTVCNETSPYGLTGAIFADDRNAIEKAYTALRQTAGNFYINDKPTGAVVGQQPFGGSRASGTNDKAGSAGNLVRWTSIRTVKETFVPPTDYRYAYMQAEEGARVVPVRKKAV